MKKKINIKIVYICLAILMIVVSAGAIYLAFTKYGSNTNKATLYILPMPYSGGHCGYVVFDESGNRTSKCLNDQSAKNAIEDLNNKNTVNTNNLIKINADIHTETERRSGSTPVPDDKDVKMIVIDRINSIEQTNITVK